MPLADHFVFSANNLQDYVDCHRRFELKYIRKQDWPAIITKPVQEVEEKIVRGSRFHRLAHQYLEHIPFEFLDDSIADPQVKEWFSDFTKFIQPYRKDTYYSEFSSVTTLANFRVIAVYDFISVTEDEQLTIADWKTTTIEPKRKFYENKIQTLLYPIVAFETFNAIFPDAAEIKPEDQSLIFWFPAFPEKSLGFSFSEEIYQHNRNGLIALIREISEKEEGTFEKTEMEIRCGYCQYRSLCDRGVEAGSLVEMGDLDIEQLIESINFGESEEISY